MKTDPITDRPIVKCKNCGNIFQGKYCNNCGQNADVKRFTMKYLMKESFISSLDIENGFFSTIKTLTLYPGKSLNNYLAGKRLSLTVPMRYLLVMAAIAAIVSIRFKVFVGYANEAPFEALKFIDQDFWDYASEFLTIHNAGAIPIFALFSYFFFKPTGHHYAENLVLNIYITAHQLFLFLLFFPIIELFLEQRVVILNVYAAVTVLYNFWVYMTFFKLKNFTGFLLTVSTLAVSYTAQLFFNYYGIFKLLKLFDLIPHLKSIDF